MWLPTPIYERLPHFLLLAGLLFLSTVMYLGVSHPLTPVYFGAGFFCSLWSLAIFELRLRNRKPARRHQNAADEAENEDESADDSGHVT